MFCSNNAINWIIYQSELVIFVINSYSTLGGLFLDTDIWDGLKENKMLWQSNAGEYQLGKYFRKYAGEISMWNSGNLKYVRF